MRSSDDVQFAEILNGLALMKTGAKLRLEAIRIWWNTLQDWSIEEFDAAATHLLKHHPKWMPDVSEFYKLRKTGAMTAQEAWQLVVSGAPLPPGSRAERVACMVGRSQQAIRHADALKDLPHIQRRFIEAYELQTDVESVRAALPNVVSPEHRLLSRKGESIDRIASRIERRIAQPPPSVSMSPVTALLPAPETPAKPTVAVDPRAKVAKLLALGMSDEDIAKVSGQSIEFVREVRASIAKEVAA